MTICTPKPATHTTCLGMGGIVGAVIHQGFDDEPVELLVQLVGLGSVIASGLCYGLNYALVPDSFDC
ncbi:MAG: hypothetical protein RLN62_03330 [Rickettsiales bacterium]